MAALLPVDLASGRRLGLAPADATDADVRALVRGWCASNLNVVVLRHAEGLLVAFVDDKQRLRQLEDAELQSRWVDCVVKWPGCTFAGGLLTKLTLDRTRLARLPDNFGDLTALQEFHCIGNTTLTSLPESLGELAALRTFECSHNPALTELPADVDAVR